MCISKDILTVCNLNVLKLDFQGIKNGFLLLEVLFLLLTLQFTFNIHVVLWLVSEETLLPFIKTLFYLNQYYSYSSPRTCRQMHTKIRVSSPYLVINIKCIFSEAIPVDPKF